MPRTGAAHPGIEKEGPPGNESQLLNLVLPTKNEKVLNKQTIGITLQYTCHMFGHKQWISSRLIAPPTVCFKLRGRVEWLPLIGDRLCVGVYRPPWKFCGKFYLFIWSQIFWETEIDCYRYEHKLIYLVWFARDNVCWKKKYIFYPRRKGTISISFYISVNTNWLRFCHLWKCSGNDCD